MVTELRQACDRCHSKKLRCARSSTQSACTRCDRAAAACVFSPPTKPVRNFPAQVRHPSVNFDWTDFLDDTRDCMLTSPSQLLPWEASPGADTQTTHKSLEGGTSVDKDSEVDRLTGLLLSIEELYTRLPGDSIHHYPQHEAAEHILKLPKDLDLQATIEKFVGLIQTLATSYPTILDQVIAEAKMSREDCQLPDCIHLEPHFSSDESLASRRHKIVSHQAHLDILFASHRRLLDLGEKLFTHGSQCHKRVHMIHSGQDPQFDVPEVRFGSIVVSGAVAALMFVNMLQESFGGLSKQLQRLTEFASSEQDLFLEPEECELVLLQCRILTRRMDKALATLIQFRDELVKLKLAF